jgi:hypothetical protein
VKGEGRGRKGEEERHISLESAWTKSLTSDLAGCLNGLNWRILVPHLIYLIESQTHSQTDAKKDTWMQTDSKMDTHEYSGY